MAAPVVAAAVATAAAPLSQQALRTEAPEIALENLSASINGREATLEKRAPDPLLFPALIGLLLARGQAQGRIADYERAAELAERLVTLAPTDAGSYAARAHVHATFHRFDAALRDLDRAKSLGHNSGHGLRASIALAQGRLADAAVALELAERHQPGDIGTATTQAVLRFEQGDVVGAEREFVRAQKLLRDVSPFPLASLYFRHGHALEGRGETERAEVFYRAALERVPNFPPALIHLAALRARTLAGLREAATMLRPLAARSDDPEAAGQLVVVLRTLGGADEALKLRSRARARYEALLAKYPEAFASHAAQYFLAAEGDTARALALASSHASHLPTREARELLLQVALAADRADVACAQARALAGSPLGPDARALRDRGIAKCPPR